tara:strand:- start:30 stop:557 length:528 start_codon:yes stop_codon:yes gene_type:complete
VSDDHPGIIAGLSKVIVELEGNIRACSQTVLKGYFTVILITDFDNQMDQGTLSARISGDLPDLHAVVQPYLLQKEMDGATDRFVLTAFGQDKAGIIYRISEYMAGKSINITDFYWDQRGDQFTLTAQVDVPDDCRVGLLQADLDEIGAELGFAVKFQHENIFLATNQLRLPKGRN